MTQQLDMMPGALADPAVLERIEAKLPKPREVKSRVLAGGVIENDPIPFADGGPVFPSDRSPAWPDVNPMRRRRLQQVRDAVDVGHELVLPKRAREDHR